jgi:hypothetical protein
MDRQKAAFVVGMLGAGGFGAGVGVGISLWKLNQAMKAAARDAETWRAQMQVDLYQQIIDQQRRGVLGPAVEAESPEGQGELDGDAR